MIFATPGLLILLLLLSSPESLSVSVGLTLATAIAAMPLLLRWLGDEREKQSKTLASSPPANPTPLETPCRSRSTKGPVVR